MWSNKPNTGLLAEIIEKNRFLILAHRGLSQGNIVENTVAAMTAGFKAGADAVEMDVIMSTDGDFFVFHDGCEPYLFADETRNLRTLSTPEIERLTYLNNIGEPTTTKVERLSDFIAALPVDKLMNMDRGWSCLSPLLAYLQQFAIAERLLLKTRAIAADMALVAEHSTPYPFIAICCSAAEVELTLSFAQQGLNVVGLELIAETNDHIFMQSDYLQSLKAQGYLLVVNALNLDSKTLLWGNYDDDTSVLRSPDLGWGKILEQGIDIINTDWPGLLSSYRKQYLGQNRQK